MTFQQLPLFNSHASGDNLAPVSIAPTRRTAPSTSHEAARKIGPHVETLCAKVLAHIRSCGKRGATRSETSAALGLASTNSGRWTTLKQDGLIVIVGERPNQNGNNEKVYVAKEYANG
jgi:hypothetical protein